jgi:hypothetical protein
MTTSDYWQQYSQDQPTFSAPLPAWRWEMPQRLQQTGRSGGGRPVLWGTEGTAAHGGGGGIAPAAQGGRPFDFQQAWDRSLARADRLRRQYETGEWSGSPQDYNDTIAPERSGGMDKVMNGPKQTGIRRDPGGWDPGSTPVRATPRPTNGNGNGNGMSGGVAEKVPTTVSSGW